MNISRLAALSLALLIILSLALVACSSPAPAPAASPTAKPSPTATAPASSPTPSPKPTAAAPINLRFAIHTSDTDARTKGQQYFADLVNKNSGGRIAIKTFTSESLVKATEEFTMAKQGNIDLLATNVAYETGKEPMFENSMLPFYVTQENLNDYFNKIAPIQEKTMQKHGIKFLYAATHGYMQVFNRGSFLKTPDEWKGQKMRLSGGYQAKFAQSMGASVVNVASTEQYTALQTGTVDGTATSTASYISFKLYEVAPYVTVVNWQSSALLIAMNGKKWDSLGADLQKIVTDAAKDAQAYSMQLMVDYEKKAVEEMTSKGAKLHQATAAERAAYIAKAQPLYDDFANRGADEKAVVDIIRSYQK